ncbi:MAG: hypothetical protein J6Y71_06915 [Ruminococcus sp.]|nr:hypothetical protein [Ruminococcus sp.]
MKRQITYTKAQIKKAEKVGIPVEDLYPADRWGVLEWLDDITYEAEEISKKYKKESRK